MWFLEDVARALAEHRHKYLKDNAVQRIDIIEWEVKSLEETDLLSIKWVWDETVTKLFSVGIYSIVDLKKNSEKLKDITLPLLGKKSLEKFLKENG